MVPYNTATAFLKKKALKSQQTAENYELSLRVFDEYLQATHKLNLETVLSVIKGGKLSVYTVLSEFVFYLSDNKSLSPLSMRTRLAAVKSYLQSADIDIINAKFRHQVDLPTVEIEDQEAIDSKDVRTLLVACTNRRLKAFLLVLASGGMRAGEGLAIRIKDVNLTTVPAKIHVRKEYARIRRARDIFISNEAAEQLKRWLAWKYSKERANPQTQVPDDLIFANNHTTKPITNPKGLYVKVLIEFQKLLEVVERADRKEGMTRHKFTMHSLRRFAKTVITDQAGQDYSEWFLGHRRSVYWQKKPEERAAIYRIKCMRFLTFLDFSGIERASQLEKENFALKQEVYEISEANRFLEEQAKQASNDAPTNAQLMTIIQRQQAEIDKLKKARG